MIFRVYFAIVFLFAALGSSFFVYRFASDYIMLEQYADVTGVPRVLLSMATGFNVLNLLMSFFLLCVAGFSYYVLKTHKRRFKLTSGSTTPP